MKELRWSMRNREASSAWMLLPNDNVLDGWAAPEVTVTLSSDLSLVIAATPMHDRVFPLGCSVRKAMCVVPRFILNKNKFPPT